MGGVAIKTLVRKNHIMSCCPKAAWGELKNPDYKEKGTVEKVGDLDIYSVGQGPKCIIWNYDIFGFDSGRSRQMCDLLADAGYLVIMPDYYRGTWVNPITDADKLPAFAKEKTVWKNLKNDLEESEEEILKNVKCPQIFMPADGDHENTYPGGLGKKVLGDALEIVTFPDMKHGWTTRGDMSDPKVDRDVKKALNLALGFFYKIYEMSRNK